MRKICYMKENFDDLASGGVLIYDTDKIKISSAKLKNAKVDGIGIPLTTFAKESGGEVMRNVVALGATLALVDQKLLIANKVIRENFKNKGPKIIANNLKAVKAGFDFVIKEYKKDFPCDLPTLKPKDNILI